MPDTGCTQETGEGTENGKPLVSSPCIAPSRRRFKFRMSSTTTQTLLFSQLLNHHSREGGNPYDSADFGFPPARE
jgi:hypothetical protein